MEFNEKLQNLRKNKNLTQEELAEKLFVSRTAVSKWESGRGLPSIDILREIASFFSVSIDDLLSSDKIITLAKLENKQDIKRLCGLFLGVVDIFCFLLIILPLYAKKIDGYVYSVTLFNYIGKTFILTVYWILFTSQTILGIIKLIFIKLKKEQAQNVITIISFTVNIITILFLAFSREPYAVSLSFLFLIVKTFILYQYLKKK